MNLSNAVVILTGASRGIGRSTAVELVKQGARVTLVARTEASLRQLAAELDSDNVLPIPADVSQPQACAEIVGQTLDRFGRVDLLINNAGIGVYGPGATVAPADVRQVMQVNFFGPLLMMQACIPQMKAQGGGLIINVSSIIGRRSTPYSGGYCASKAALEHLVESMRVELAADNIRFSTLYPGVTQTDFVPNSLGGPTQRRGRVTGVSARRVAVKMIRVAQNEPRDAYVTLVDWAYVAGSRLLPGVVDWVFARYF